MLKGQEELLQLKQREVELDEQHDRMAEKFEHLDRRQLPGEEMDSIDNQQVAKRYRRNKRRCGM